MELRNLSDEEKMLIARFRLCCAEDKEKILQKLGGTMDEGEAQKDSDALTECE